MFIVASILTGASVGMAMYSQYQQGKAGAAAGKYKASIERMKAENTEREFHENTLRQRRNDREVRSAITGRQARSGFTLNSESALNIIGEAAGRQQLAIADAARAANQQATDARQRGDVAIYEGNQARYASKLSMLGTGLEEAAGAFSTVNTGKDIGTVR